MFCCVVSLYAHMYTGYSLVNKSSRENYKNQLLAALDFSAGSSDGMDSVGDSVAENDSLDNDMTGSVSLKNNVPENNSPDNDMTGSDSLENDLLETAPHGTNFSCVTAEEFHKTFSDREENFKTQCDTLNLTAADSFSYDDTVLQLTYTDTKGGMVFLSIPYSSGFTAYADDTEVDIHIVDGGLMSVCIPTGTETLKLTYREPGLSVGIILSIIGVLLWGALFFSSVHKKR